MITRAVPLDEEQYLFIEDLGKALMRDGRTELATRVLAIALAWKVAPIVRFGCDVDESAGMAEVIDLNGNTSLTAQDPERKKVRYDGADRYCPTCGTARGYSHVSGAECAR